jgi:hypothetical protein
MVSVPFVAYLLEPACGSQQALLDAAGADQILPVLLMFRMLGWQVAVEHDHLARPRPPRQLPLERIPLIEQVQADYS